MVDKNAKITLHSFYDCKLTYPLLAVSETIVGVNKYKLETETRIDVRAIDNTAVRKQQVARIQKMKDSRNAHQVG